MKVEKYFSKLRKAIELEYESELKDFQQKIKEFTINERIADGITVYPLTLDSFVFSHSGQIIITLELTKGNFSRGRFRNGTLVEIFDADKNKLQGIIKGTPKRGQFKIVIKEDSIPDFIEKGKLGINLLPDTKTNKVINWALDKIEKAENKERVARLRDVLIGEKETSYVEETSTEYIDFIRKEHLNESQNNAVVNAQFDKEISLLHGPPGTGKTTTLVEIIKQAVKNKKKVLVTAPSNMAVDWLSEKLIQNKINVVRLGNPVRVSEGITENTLEYKIENHLEAKLIKKWRADYLKTINKAKQFKRTFDETARAERKSLFAEARELKATIFNTEKQIINQILNRAEVVSCTLTGAGDSILNGYHFDLGIVDEAGQAIEPLNWIITLKADKVLLAGDPCQLPATVKSKEAQKLGLEKSLLEKTIENNFNNHFLDTQYRMNEQIMAFSNLKFYESRLKAHITNATHQINGLDVFTFIDTAGTGMNEKVSETQGKSNEEEADLLIKFLKLKFENIQEDLKNISIGILSPYSDQVDILKEKIGQEVAEELQKNIKVNTIDSFQGQEKDVILISLVRSNEKGEIGFLKDYRRMNVAMTRAKKSLIIFGDSATISNDKFYEDLINFAETNNAYKSAWEFLY